MKIRTTYASAAAVLLVTGVLAAQDKPHWGVQADVGWTNIPHVITDQIGALPERPDIAGRAYQVGLVHFHASGAPSYALQFSRLTADMNGALQNGAFRREIRGSGSLRGFMATKYVNVVTRKYVSGGFAFGGGIGKGEASYVRTQTFQGIAFPSQADTYDRVIPLFEMLGRVDVRPTKHLTIGPYYGLRNGMFAAGLAVRFHAVR